MTRVYLHVGAPKTGTTYLQDVLWSNRAELARQGVLYGGDSASAHFHAAQDLRGRHFRGHENPRVHGAWERLARAAREWTGPTVLVSHEILAGCDPDEAQRAVESLLPHEVHVVYTARDLGRQIPAMWQESVKNGRVVPYRRYLQTLQSDEPQLVGRIFWRTQDAVAVLERWGAAVPAERTHVVTVPPRGSGGDVLWQRFCAVTGLQPGPLDTTGGGSDGNVSLGLAQAELLRRLNKRLEGSLPWPRHEALLKGFLTREVLTGQDATVTGVPAADRDWVVRRSQTLVDGLQAHGYDVVGALDELLPDFGDEPDHPADPDTDDVLDAAVDALATLLTGHVHPPGPSTTDRARQVAAAAGQRLRRMRR